MFISAKFFPSTCIHWADHRNSVKHKFSIAGNSLTDSSKTLSKALVSESGHEHLISSPVQKYTVDLVVEAKFSQTEQQCTLLTTSLLYLGSSCASPSMWQGWGGRGYPWSVNMAVLTLTPWWLCSSSWRECIAQNKLPLHWPLGGSLLGWEQSVNSRADTNFCIWKALKCFRSYILSYMTDIQIAIVDIWASDH